VRLHGLLETPDAFLASYEEEREMTLAEIAEHLGRDPVEAFVLGAFAGEELCGVLGLARSHFARERHKATVWGMYVMPDHRRAGVARTLLSAAVERAHAIGLSQLALAVHVDNDPARALYRSVGFVAWGVERDAFRVAGRPIDEEHMVLVLPGAKRGSV
jgi:ribosomal protein S18 acetylase RimI-like enzyme